MQGYFATLSITTHCAERLNAEQRVFLIVILTVVILVAIGNFDIEFLSFAINFKF
jgi:hypothetical protein